MDKKLVQLEFDKFTRKNTSDGVAPVAVANPDGSLIGSGPSTTPISLASLPVPVTLQSNATLNPSPNFIGLISAASIHGKFEIVSTPSSMITGVSSATSSTTILASNTLRKGGYIFNDSTAICYVKLGAAASITSHTVQIASKGFYELPSPVYNGVINAIWGSVNGSVLVTETT